MRSNDPHDNGVEPLRDELYPRCAGCGYRLEGLPEPRCPECGGAFDPADARTFEFIPPFDFWTYWLPGLLLGMGLAILPAVGLGLAGEPGQGLALGAALFLGVMVGYGLRANVGCVTMLALLIGGGALVGLISGDEFGPLWGVLTGMLLTPPVAVGVAFGAGLKGSLKKSKFDQRWHLP